MSTMVQAMLAEKDKLGTEKISLEKEIKRLQGQSKALTREKEKQDASIHKETRVLSSKLEAVEKEMEKNRTALLSEKDHRAAAELSLEDLKKARENKIELECG